ncbi:FAD-binding oxidoreductase [Candidatus Parcubacteria bacterium]|nr:FAD-binding oxidoreductase [Candidatus Parcubacteria bacterium]
MKHEIFWQNPGYVIRPELKEDIECDYLIVGGGITGVSAAHFLTKFGAQNVVLVEKQYIGSGATGKAAGTLVTRGERDLTDMIKEYGLEKTHLLWNKTHEALRALRQIIATEAIDCDAESQDTLICGFPGKNYNNLYEEYEAEKRIESTTRILEGDELKKEINSPLFNHGVLSAQHGLCVDPLRFVQGFSGVVEKNGVRIYENTAVVQAINGIARTNHGTIKYKKIIWAIDVDYPSDDIRNLRTTIIVTRPLTSEEVMKIGFAERKKVVWDSRKNENYFKLTKDNRILLGFGGIVVHKKHRKTDPHFPHLKQLQGFIKRIFPYLDLEIEYTWSGHFGVNKHWSQGPFIKVSENEATISGAGSQVVCFMAGEHIAHKLLGKPSPSELYFGN